MSSYDEGAVGGDSPTRLIRFPGDPAMPMPEGMPLVHSRVLKEFELLVARDVVETASRRGEASGLEDGVAGLISGDSVGGEGLDEKPLVPFPLLADGQPKLIRGVCLRPTRTLRHVLSPPQPLHRLLCHSSCPS